MRFKKLITFLIVVLSFSSFSRGQISFSKQREFEIKKQEESEQIPKQIKSEPKVKNNERFIRKSILDTAFTKINTPYVYGADGKNGAYDCSSYVQYVYKKALNINLPRVSYQQAAVGKKVPINQLKAGDLVTFNTLGKNQVSHIGIYIGNGEFIHASSGSKKVVVSELKGYYAEKFLFGVKII